MLSLGACFTLCIAVANAHPWRFWGAGPDNKLFVPGVGLVYGSSSSVDDIKVNQYLGIPFAKNPPPRFGPAEESGWLGKVNATAYGATCLEQGTPDPDLTESESCLTLNIVTPAGADRKSKLPVMVWIYGGNLASGSTNLTFYNGSSFAANQDIVFVSINYRTNIFGFSMTPYLPLTDRNVGFLDQRLALRWVQKHIGTFGGDAEKVTVFGESAGAFSVQQLVTFAPDPPTFRAAILESRGFSGPKNGTSGWDSAVTALGCGGQDELACMRSKDAFEIRNKTTNIQFGPILDDATYANNTAERVANGQGAKVPILIGTNSNEGTTLALFFTFAPAQVITDYEFTCTTGKYSAALQNASYSIWRYYYNASFPNTTPFPGAQAYHGSEIPEVFGTYPREGATDQQIALSRYMQTAWADFAKNPSAGPRPDWPEFGSEGNILRLGHDGSSGGDLISAASIESGPCPVYSGLIDVTGYRKRSDHVASPWLFRPAHVRPVQ